MKRYWIIALALILTACSGSGQRRTSLVTRSARVVSWWVSPSNIPAFEVLLNAFKAENPDVEVIDGAIAGGGGSNVQVALAARLRAGDPPMQRYLGSSLRAWVDAGRIADVSAVYERTGLDQTLQQTLLDAATYRVKAWGVPTGSHRGNVLWFNQRVLRDAAVAPPDPATPPRPSATIWPRWRQAVERRVSWRQGQVHRDGAVREHSAGGDRPERMDQDQRRRVRLAGITTQGGAQRVSDRSSPEPTRMPAVSRGIRRRRSWRRGNAHTCR